MLWKHRSDGGPDRTGSDGNSLNSDVPTIYDAPVITDSAPMVTGDDETQPLSTAIGTVIVGDPENSEVLVEVIDPNAPHPDLAPDGVEHILPIVFADDDTDAATDIANGRDEPLGHFIPTGSTGDFEGDGRYPDPRPGTSDANGTGDSDSEYFDGIGINGTPGSF